MASSSGSDNPTKKITLRTSDGHLFDVEEEVAMEFLTVKTFFEENSDGADHDTHNTTTAMPLPNVSAPVLNKVISYSKTHLQFAASTAPQKQVRAFDDRFLKDENNETIIELIHAANYLHVKDLYDFLTKAMADRIKNRSVEYVRELFGIENDYTPEEYKAVREETAWAFEGGVDRD